MDDSARAERHEALRTITELCGRVAGAKEKFAPGTSQYSLQQNRLKALRIAASLMENVLAQGETAEVYSREDMLRAVAPLDSLISKSEKAREKVPQSSWQYAMLARNLKALHMALLLLTQALGEMGGEGQ